MKIFLFDLEIKPIVALIWSLRQKYIAPDMVIEDWGIISWAGKWLGDPPGKILYADTRRMSEKQCVGRLLQEIEKADVIIAHNGFGFDFGKLNTRLKALGYKPPAPTKKIDTCRLYQRVFGETSNSLGFLADKYNKKYKKLKHAKFPGNDLWKECRLGNLEAWREMEKYNKHDVLALEELFQGAAPWDHQCQFFINGDDLVCVCGSEEFEKRGYATTTCGKFQRYVCKECGHWTRDTRRLRNVSRTGVVR